MALPLVTVLWLRSKTPRDTLLSAVSAGLMLVFLAYTRTRGAWMGLGAAAMVTVAFWAFARLRWHTSFLPDGVLCRQRSGLVPAAVALFAALILALVPARIVAPHSRAIDEGKASLVDALVSVKNPGADRGRLSMWGRTLDMIGDYPVCGVGPGNWRFAYPRYDGGVMLKPGSAPERPHNDLLWIASETGVLGLVAYIAILIAAATASIRAVRRPREPDSALLTIGFGCSILAAVGHGMFSFPREPAETSLLFWGGLGVLGVLAGGEPGKAGAHQRRRLGAVALGLASAVLLLAFWANVRFAQFDGHYLLALQYQKGNDYRSVLRSSDEALEHGPFRPQAFLLRSKGHQSVGAVDRARRDCLQGLRYHPHSVELLAELGNCYALLDSLDSAESCYLRALSLSQEYTFLHSNLGNVYQQRGDLSAAIEAYTQALARNPSLADAHANLGLAFLSAGRPDDAIRAFEEAIRQVPGDPALHHNLADAHFAKSREDPSSLPLALREYRRFLRTWRGPEADAALARTRVAEIGRRLSGEAP